MLISCVIVSLFSLELYILLPLLVLTPSPPRPPPLSKFFQRAKRALHSISHLMGWVLTVAFNSLVIGVILFQYLSYSIPITLLLIRGRSTLPRGPFFLGKIGLICNIVTYHPYPLPQPLLITPPSSEDASFCGVI